MCDNDSMDVNATGPKEMSLTATELELLWEFLSYQYIPYDNIELRLLVRKLGRIVDELAEYPNRAT